VSLDVTSPHGHYNSAPYPERRYFGELQIVRFDSSFCSMPNQEQMPGCNWPFLVFYSRSGSDSVIIQAGQSTKLGANECCVVRNDAPYRIISKREQNLIAVYISGTIGAPHRFVFARADGLTWSATDGPVDVGILLDGLRDEHELIDPSSPIRLAQLIVSAIALMCQEAISSQLGHADRLLTRCQDYIEMHLGEVDLTPDRIAKAHHISTRALHRLFERESSSVSAWIRTRRLEQCRVDLTDEALEELSINQIHQRWGLFDAAHFSRSFKASYGVSPRTFRLANRRPSSASRRPADRPLVGLANL